MLPVLRPHSKPRCRDNRRPVPPKPALPPDACVVCKGVGQVEGEPCGNCDSTGKVFVGYRDPAINRHYVALVGADVIDGPSRNLCGLVAQLLADWSDSESDITVVKVEDPDGEPAHRVAAILRPHPSGGLMPTWF